MGSTVFLCSSRDTVLLPGPLQWVKHPPLLQLWSRLQSLAQELHMPWGGPPKKYIYVILYVLLEENLRVPWWLSRLGSSIVTAVAWDQGLDPWLRNFHMLQAQPPPPKKRKKKSLYLTPTPDQLNPHLWG